jgi:hypothetical protein
LRLFVVRNNQPFGRGNYFMTASLYRRYAAECLQILATTKDAKNSAALRAMAIAWTDLAELAEGRAPPLDSKNAEAASGER